MADGEISDNFGGRGGIQECVAHGLVRELPPRYVRSGEVAVGVQFTVHVGEAKTTRLNGQGLPVPHVHSEHAITDPALQQLLALNPKTGVSALH